MKPHIRILLIAPFALVASVYFKYTDPDQHCEGMADLLFNSILYVSLLLTGIIAFIGIFRKRQNKKWKFHPLTSIIISASVLFLTYCIFFGGMAVEKNG